jgi:hypothetical protein
VQAASRRDSNDDFAGVRQIWLHRFLSQDARQLPGAARYGMPRFSAYFDRDPSDFGTFRAFDFD